MENKKTCRICKTERDISEYPADPYFTNGVKKTRLRSECKHCRNRLVRERNKKNGTYKKQYWSMSDEDRAKYIKYKSEINQIRFKTKPEVLARKKHYERTDKGIWNRYVGDSKRGSRAIRGIKLEINFEHFCQLINSPCTYCGVENCRGIDRADSNISYTVENSKPCCRICNTMKNSLSVDDFLVHIKKIHDNTSN